MITIHDFKKKKKNIIRNFLSTAIELLFITFSYKSRTSDKGIKFTQNTLNILLTKELPINEKKRLKTHKKTMGGFIKTRAKM